MPRPHILLASQTREGLAVPISVPRLSFASAHTSGLAVRLEGQSDRLFDSFRQAGDLAWRVLMCSPVAAARGAGEPSRFGYQLQTPGTEPLVDQWGSADLAFFVTALLDRLALACGEVGSPISPLAATGHMFGVAETESETPRVQRVGGISSKLRAAIEAFAAQPETARILIPRDNLSDLLPEHLAWVQRGVIVPVFHLEDVLDALRTLPILPHSMRDVLKDLHAPFEGNPYRGIEAFGIEHRGLYFGRQKRIDEVLSKLPDAVDAELPAVLITGFSGSGKSSLLLAGVLGTVLCAEVKRHRFHPQLASHNRKTSVAWRVPATSNTEATLCADLSAHWQALLNVSLEPVQSLQAIGDLLVPLLKPRDGAARWVFALDQLEGLVTQVALDEAAHQHSLDLLKRFSQLLERLIKDAGVWVIATLRTGYLEALGPLWKRVFHAAAHVDLGQPIGSDAGLDELTDAERWERREAERRQFLQEVIERPAILAGFGLEEGLLEDLVRDARDPQSLPLLQFALQALYEYAAQRRGQSNQATLMMRADYDAIGGIRGAINQRANQLLAKVPEDRNVLLGALARLAREHVDGNGQREYVRTTVAWSAYSDHEQEVLKPWFNADHRLLTLHGDQVEVAHEALLREFTALRDWLLSNAQLLRWRQDHLLPQMRRWLGLDKNDNNLLLARDDLATGERGLSQAQLLGEQEAAFVQISLVAATQRADEDQRRSRELDEAKRRALRRTRIGLLVAVVLTGIAILSVLRAKTQLEEAAVRALSRANEALANENLKGHYAFLAESLSYAPNRTAIAAAELALLRPVFAQSNREFRAAVVHDTSQKFEFYSMAQIGLGTPTFSFSPDGQRILTAGDDGSARTWAANTGDAISALMVHEAPVPSAVFSPDGNIVLTASYDKTVRLWDAKSGTPIRTPLIHEDEVSLARFSPDGDRILTCDNKVRLWDTQTGRQLCIVIEDKRLIYGAEFSPDGASILSSSLLRGVQISDSRTCTRIGETIGSGIKVSHAKFSPNGLLVLTDEGRDGTITVWNAKSRALVMRRRHGLRISSVQFSPDSRWVVTTGNDMSARIWNSLTGEQIAEMRHQQIVNGAEFSPDGRWIVTSGETSLVWDAKTGASVGTTTQLIGTVQEARFSPDGRWIGTAEPGGVVRIWTAQSGNYVSEFFYNDTGLDYSLLSPDDRSIAVISNKSARIWSVQEGSSHDAQIRHHSILTSASFSPDSRLLVTTSIDDERQSLGTAQILDVMTGGQIGRLIVDPDHPHGDYHQVKSADFSPDGRFLLTTSSLLVVHSAGNIHSGVARIWQAQSGKPTELTAYHGEGVDIGQFSPDGKWFLTADSSSDGTAFAWDAKSMMSIGKPMRAGSSVISVDISNDSRRIVTGAIGVAQIWEAKSGDPVGVPMKVRDGHEVRSVQFSANQRWVVTSSPDGVQVWDARTGQPHGKPIETNKDAIWGACFAAFSSDSRFILTGTSGGLVRLWDVETGFQIGPPRAGGCHPQFSSSGNWIVSGARMWPAITYLSADPAELIAALRALSGVEIDSSGKLAELSIDEQLRTREALRHSATGDRAFDDVIRWQFADPPTRTISPFSSHTTPQFVERAIDFARTGDPTDADQRKARTEILEEAYRLDPGHPLILLALSAYEEHPDTLRLWKDLSLKRIATDARIAARGSEMLQLQGDKEYARRAAEIALGLDSNEAKAKAVLEWATASTH